MRKMRTVLEAVTLKELYDLALFSQCLKSDGKSTTAKTQLRTADNKITSDAPIKRLLIIISRYLVISR